MNKTILIIVIVLVIIVGGYFILKGRYQAPAELGAPTTGTSSDETSGTPGPGEGDGAPAPTGVKEVNIAGTEFAFSPSAITVKAGEKVKLNFRNNGGAPHSLIIQGLGVGTKTIGGGQTDTVEFTALASGSYTFFCSVPGHKAAGMEGSLEVE